MSVAVYEQTVRLLCLCLYARLCHAGLVEGDLSARLDLLDALHGVERGEDELPVVSDGDVALLFEFERGVERHLLAVGLAEGLCPSYLSGVSLQLEVLVALGLAELEDLCVVAHEGDALARVAGRGAEEAVLDPHGGVGGDAKVVVVDDKGGCERRESFSLVVAPRLALCPTEP